MRSFALYFCYVLTNVAVFQVISEDVGLKLENVTLDMLGQAKKVSITKDDTIVLGGAGAKDQIDERTLLLKDSIEQSKVTKRQNKAYE